MSRPSVVTVTPWESLESDCVRSLLADHAVTEQAVRPETTGVVLLVPRRMSPWPVRLPNGSEERRLPVVVVADAVDPWSIAFAQSLGASALTAWSQPADEIVQAVCHGIRQRSVGTPRRQRPDPLSRLTEREREVLTMITRGDHDRLIAARLGISINTVRTHVQHCLAKLEVSHRHAAAALVHGTLVPRPRERNWLEAP